MLVEGQLVEFEGAVLLAEKHGNVLSISALLVLRGTFEILGFSFGSLLLFLFVLRVLEDLEGFVDIVALVQMCLEVRADNLRLDLATLSINEAFVVIEERWVIVALGLIAVVGCALDRISSLLIIAETFVDEPSAG